MGRRSEGFDVAAMLERSDLDVYVEWPEGLARVSRQGLINLAPWHILPRDLARERLRGLRQRYAQKYVPFAYRQDNDDLACITPEQPDEVVIVHDFASEGTEARERFDSFWEWFRSAVEDMILFD